MHISKKLFFIFTVISTQALVYAQKKTSLYDRAIDSLSKEDKELPSVPNITIPSIDIADKNGMTLLMKASMESNDWLIKELLKNGADLHKRDNDGWTALMYAAKYSDNYTTVKILVDNGAYIQVRNKFNSTPLLLAAAHSQNPEILNLLLQKRSASEEEVLDAFILTIKDNESPTYIKLEKMRLFINKGIALNVFWKGATPLMYACSYGDSSEPASFLIEYGANPNIRDENGRRAYEWATQNPGFPHDETYRMLDTNNARN